MYHHQSYCDYEQTMVTEWRGITAMSLCPNNPSHNLAENSDTIIKVARFSANVAENFSTSSTSYVSAGNFPYQGTDFYGNDTTYPKYLKVTASVSVGTFYLRLIDINNNVLWSPTGYTGSSNQTIIFDFGTITPPTGEILLILQTKTTGGTVTITNSSVFAEATPQ